MRVVPSASATEFVLFDGSIVRQRRADALTLSSTAGNRFTKHVVFEVPRSWSRRTGAPCHSSVTAIRR